MRLSFSFFYNTVPLSRSLSSSEAHLSQAHFLNSGLLSSLCLPPMLLIRRHHRSLSSSDPLWTHTQLRPLKLTRSLKLNSSLRPTPPIPLRPTSLPLIHFRSVVSIFFMWMIGIFDLGITSKNVGFLIYDILLLF